MLVNFFRLRGYYHEHYHLKQSDFLLFVKGTNRSLQYETFIEPIAYWQNIYITTNINSEKCSRYRGYFTLFAIYLKS